MTGYVCLLAATSACSGRAMPPKGEGKDHHPPEAVAFPGSGTPAPERRETGPEPAGSTARVAASQAKAASRGGAGQHETDGERAGRASPTTPGNRLPPPPSRLASPGGRSGGAPFRLSPSTACWLSRFRRAGDPPRVPMPCQCAIMPAVISQLWGRPGALPPRRSELWAAPERAGISKGEGGAATMSP